ncbi:SH3 domain-containing protein [uncultured Roseovarius sp.]|uniref:SH3 domain-containing protein n=1 Tax=uncultured Roseovarius sp. TaxID=293344 RepID=UPI00263306FA|nr:SH3 domain-containing protein [uncultured Roseovarius sp.]
MWRLIFVSFALLGWSFYELSGGADYRPSANSIQARAVLDNQRPRPRPLRVNIIELAQDGAVQPETEVTRTITSLHDLGLSIGKRVTLTLASAQASAPSAPVRIDVPTVKATAPVPLPDTPAVTADARLPDPTQETLTDPLERRVVAGRSVNLRTGPGTGFGRITSLKRGTDVIVLRDPGTGWIKLRVPGTGRIGWMADRLLTVASE